MEEEKKEKEQIELFEKRNYRFSNDVTFEFDIDVSEPEKALVEIADFKELMIEAVKKLDTLKEEFVAKIEKQKQVEKPVKQSD